MTRGRRFGALRFRSGQALKSCPSKSARAGTLAPTSTTVHERGRSRLHRQPRTSEEARAYIDNSTRAGTLAPTSTTAHERDARAYIDNSTRAETLAPTSTTVHERGRSRLHQQPSAGGGAHATR